MTQKTHFQIKHCKSPGFTLVEVLITLVIITIMAAIAAPAMMTMAPNMALKSAAQDLFSTIQEAKIRAIKENQNITIRFDTAGFYYFDDDNDGVWDDADADGVWDPGDEERVVLGEDIDGDLVLDAGEDFNGDGNLDRNYGITYGNGAAANDWNGVGIVNLNAVTFNARGLATLTPPGPPPAPPSSPNVYIQNPDGLTYAIVVRVAGSVTLRKFNGTNWE